MVSNRASLKSYAKGYADVQHYLGLMFSKGLGVPQDYAEALKWYRLAARQGFVPLYSPFGSQLFDRQLSFQPPCLS